MEEDGDTPSPDPGPAKVEPLHELIRNEREHLAGGTRQGLALMAGGSLLHESDVPLEKVPPLLAANLLRQLGADAETWRERRDTVEAAASPAVVDWPSEEWVVPPRPFSGPSDARKALERVLEQLEAYEEAARWAEQIVEDAGFTFNWETGELKQGKKGALRVVLEDILEAGDFHRKNDEEKRQALAADLAPYFSDEQLDPEDGDGILKHTIRNASGDE